MSEQRPVFVYVGSYTTERTPPDRFVPAQGAAKGIRVFRVDPVTLEWQLIQEAEQLNPMYLLFGKGQKTLYAASSDSSSVYAYRIDSNTGLLSPLNNQQIAGRSTLCLSATRNFTHLIVGAISGAIASISLCEDGSLGSVCDNFNLPGERGPLRDEQPCPRPHHCPFDLLGEHCYVLDKGGDAVDIYNVDCQTGKMELHARLLTRPGSIPRHIAFHPNGRFAYINTEHIGTVISCRIEQPGGDLTPFQILPTIPEDYVGNYSLSSEIAVHPSGKWLYVSNRGHNSIAVFSIDPFSGTLKILGWQSTLGEIPRYFSIEPGGRFLYAANQKSGTIQVFSIDLKTGLLSFSGQTVKTPTPVWMLFSGPIPSHF